MRKPFSGTIFSALILLSVILLNFGCSKTPTGNNTVSVPSVVTLNLISNVTQTTASSGGIVTNGNGGPITSNGVCWSSTNQLPTVSDSKTTDTIGVNGFNSKVTGLTLNTTYYLRAYASNSAGVGYGIVLTFKTNATGAALTTTVSTIAGSLNYGYQDGTGASALFNGPQAIAFNPVAGNLYVSDVFNNRIRTMTTGGTVSTLTPQSTLGYVDGPLANAQFYAPSCIAFDTQGNAYVADQGNNRIRKITTAGVVSTFAGNGLAGYVDGAGSIAEFNNPQGIAVDSKGNVFVADKNNNIIREISPAGVVGTLAGVVPAIGVGIVKGWFDSPYYYQAKFNAPTAVALDPAGNVYVADAGNSAIRMITIATGAVTTLAGNPVQNTVVGTPSGMVSDATGNLFITDSKGRVLEITAAHTLYVLAGAANTAGFADGAGTAALFSSPQGIAVDAAGNVYVADFNNNSIRKIVLH